MKLPALKRWLLTGLLWWLPVLACAAGADPVVMLGGPLAESCPMMLMAAEDAFASVGRKSVFVPWQSPDQYRAMMVSGQADFVVLSTLEYARLARRLEGVEPLFTVAGSSLWLLGRLPDIPLDALRGKTIALPFRGGMPEITLGMLLREAPVAMKDVRIVSAGGAVTSAQLVMTGRADYALVAEPVAAMMVAASKSHPHAHAMHYALDMEAAWRKLYPNGPELLLSHIVALEAPEELRRLFCERYRTYAARCRDNPQAAVPVFQQYFPVLPAKSIRALLSADRGKVYGAAEKKRELQRFMQRMQRVADETR